MPAVELAVRELRFVARRQTSARPLSAPSALPSAELVGRLRPKLLEAWISLEVGPPPLLARPFSARIHELLEACDGPIHIAHD